MVTYYCVNGENRNRSIHSAPAECFRVGKSISHALTQIGVAPEDCQFAFATCMFEIMGGFAHNHNGDSLRVKPTSSYAMSRWAHTRLRVLTPKVRPPHFVRAPNGTMIRSDSFDGMNLILGCFGLSTAMITKYYGRPKQTERQVFDLPTLIRALAPELLPATKSAAGAA